MLKTIGVASIEDLLRAIPEPLRLRRPLRLPPGMSEWEVRRHLEALASRNRASDLVCFLGAGAYDHFVPAAVDALAGRSEFATAYTPYQSERSQGVLQAIYEFQSLVCALTGMEIANASMYDGATALAEAAFMALRCLPNRNHLVVCGTVHPHYRQVLRTYVDSLPIRLREIPWQDGITDPETLRQHVTEETAAIVVQHPNFFGCLEEAAALAAIAHGRGALLVVSADPITLGLLRRPGDLGADIVVGECQPLGTPLSFGGPYAGFIAARAQYLRQMPGRIAGATVDAEGKRGFVLTLQTREQHIRRERATSNICTNEALVALRATIYLAAMGKEGLREVASLCLQKSHYLRQKLQEIPGFTFPFPAPTFKEFVVNIPQPPARLNRRLLKRGFLGGLDLGRYGKKLKNHWLLCVTEQRTREEMDAFVEAIQEATSRDSGGWRRQGAPRLRGRDPGAQPGDGADRTRQSPSERPGLPPTSTLPKGKQS